MCVMDGGKKSNETNENRGSLGLLACAHGAVVYEMRRGIPALADDMK